MGITSGYHIIRSISPPLILALGLAATVISMPNPFISFAPGIFFGFVPLLIFNRSSSIRTTFLMNLIFSELFAIAILFPIDLMKINPDLICMFQVAGLFGSIAFIYAVMLTVCAILSNKYGWHWSPLIYGAGWILAQYLLSFIPYTFPFPVETALWQLPVLLQSARVFGPGFIGSFIITTNALLANMLAGGLCGPIIILMILHMLNFSYGTLSMFGAGHTGERVMVAIIQSSMKNEGFKKYNNVRLYAESKLSICSLEKHPNLIIWPEMTGSYLLQNDSVMEYLESNITSKGSELIAGTSYADHAAGRSFNVAFLMGKGGEIAATHAKTRVFPFSETSIYSSGRETVLLRSSTKLGNVGCMICLESLYPQISMNMKKSGANLLICLSNDASFGKSMIPYIHCAQMVIRAIENDRYAIHASNSGPSIVCDNKGRIITLIPFGRSAYAVASI